jgi:3-deoxy-D-arabino-heptulosonate 7-phosphate (DAHP) synthase
MNLKLIRELPAPAAVKTQLPVTPELAARKAQRDSRLRDILAGRSMRRWLHSRPP